MPIVWAYRQREPQNPGFLCLHILRLRWASRCDCCREYFRQGRRKPAVLLGGRWFGRARAKLSALAHSRLHYLRLIFQSSREAAQIPNNRSYICVAQATSHDTERFPNFAEDKQHWVEEPIMFSEQQHSAARRHKLATAGVCPGRPMNSVA